MDFKLIVFFAFFVTVHGLDLNNEIVQIFNKSCNGDAAKLHPLKLDFCNVDVEGYKSPFSFLCNVTKDVMADICNKSKGNVDQFLNSVGVFSNGTAFCSNQSTPFKLTTDRPKYLSKFVIKFNSNCAKLCSSFDDELYPQCPFIVSYLRFQEKKNTPVKIDTSNIDKQTQGKKDPSSIGHELHSEKDLFKNQTSKTHTESPTSAKESSVSPVNPISSLNKGEKSDGNPPTQLLSERKDDKKDQLGQPSGDSHHNPPSEQENDKGQPPPLDNGNDVNEPVNEFKDDNPPGMEDQEEDFNKIQPENIPAFPEKSEDSSPIPSNRPKGIVVSEPFVDSPNPHFFTYFLIISALCIFFYVAMYNKKKILALMIEGRRSNVKRRPNSAAYSKLDCNLEEAMTSGPSTSTSNTLLY